MYQGDLSSTTHRANLVAQNWNNNSNKNNIADANMLDSSDEKNELDIDYEMSDEEYDSYYYYELFVEYNSHPTPKLVQSQPNSNNVLKRNSIQRQSVSIR